MKTLGFTGTQQGMTVEQQMAVAKLVDRLGQRGFRCGIHGDCIGADDAFSTMLNARRWDAACRPCTIRSKRAHTGDRELAPPAPPLVRNRKIVDEVDALIAAPKTMEEELRSGTWATFRYALKKKKPIWIVWPDGSMTEIDAEGRRTRWLSAAKRAELRARVGAKVAAREEP